VDAETTQKEVQKLWVREDIPCISQPEGRTNMVLLIETLGIP